MRSFSSELILILSLGPICLGSAYGQIHSDLYEGPVQVGIFGDLVTSARLYPASRDADPTISETYYGLGLFLSEGLDLRMSLNRSNSIGIVLQPLHLKKTTSTIYGYDRAGNYLGVPVNDGFTIYAVEVNGYFRIPVVGDAWSIYLGGGPAVYLGRRVLAVGNAEAVTPYATAAGIQVLAGVSFMFADHFGVRSELKFRSPELNTVSTFNSSYTVYDGVRVSLPGTLYSKVNVDGTDFTLGVFFEP